MSPVTPSADEGAGGGGELKMYSNALSATKLLLGDMNDLEVQQLQIWCAKELMERKK